MVQYVENALNLAFGCCRYVARAVKDQPDWTFSPPGQKPTSWTCHSTCQRTPTQSHLSKLLV